MRFFFRCLTVLRCLNGVPLRCNLFNKQTSCLCLFVWSVVYLFGLLFICLGFVVYICLFVSSYCTLL